ncbi:hypothetical protein HWV07_04370 [Natronomonas salina]|uniref:hypothetical protein n=1 Tax=Natronomonas salina TaxID=1710540 RepID=UPI0015B5A8B1|nr:hypothetical protein [Natronomonas salina]QLD88308.1 hypothetical protein HWV07_04370 [Natronomonas salina]
MAAEERQLPLDEFTTSTSTDENRCEAYADSTGDRCQHDAIPGIPYCGTHKHLLDDVDVLRMGLKSLKSDG